VYFLVIVISSHMHFLDYIWRSISKHK